ncbi:LCP family protein [Arthrobacter sp. MMS24-S77]
MIEFPEDGTRDALNGNEAARKRRRKARNVFLGFLSVFFVVALVCGIYVVNLAMSFSSKTQTLASAFPAETNRPPIDTSAGAKAENILLLGSDNSSGPVNASGSGDERSDTIMWVHVPADRKNIYVMSIMRDTWVDIPGHGEAKINAALAQGGVSLVVETLERMFSTRIDHVVAVQLEGFKAATDAIGGVEVDVPYAFNYGDMHFEPGRQVLNGDRALGFVRERHSFVDGDYQRVRDQQIFAKSLMSKILSADTLSNPAKVSTLVNTVSPSISMDPSLNGPAVVGLALELRGLHGSDVRTFTLPNLGTGWSPDGQQSIVINDPTAVAGIGQAMAGDSLGSYLQRRELLANAG